MSNPLTPPGSKLKFFSVEGEIGRTYVFPGFDEVIITGSVSMAIDKSDKSHRILDSGNIAHQIPADWIHLSWTVEDDDTTPMFPW
jgi:hypothetical protein